MPHLTGRDPGFTETALLADPVGRDSAADPARTCVVLQYSRVTLLIHDPLHLAVQPFRFERQMEYLAENYNVLSADDLVYRLTKGAPFPRRSVILMFDGGYADLLYTVQGVLDRLSLSALAFVPTATVLKKGLRWYDTLENLLLPDGVCGECELVIDDEVLSLSLYDRYERFVAYTQLVSLLSRKSPAQQRAILNQIEQALPPCEGEVDGHTSLDAQELKHLDEEGNIRLGSSTHHHVDPDTLTPWERSLEIGKNKEVLEEVLGRRITFFSNPFWAIHDPSAGSMDLLWKLGFTFAYYNTSRSMTLCTKSARLTLPRITVGDVSALALHQQLALAGWPSTRSEVQNEDQATYRG